MHHLLKMHHLLRTYCGTVLNLHEERVKTREVECGAGGDVKTCRLLHHVFICRVFYVFVKKFGLQIDLFDTL